MDKLNVSEVVRGSERLGDLALGADVVVVGSGAGGAVAARVLAERGLSVIVVEEGAPVTAAEHGAMRPTESLRYVWRDGGMSFAVGLGDTPLINVTMGKVLGGSSMVTGGVCFRTPPAVTKRWREERKLAMLTDASLEPHYDAVERWTKVKIVPEDMRSKAVVRFGEGLKARHHVELEPLYRNTEGCQGKGRCNFGCPHSAKLSVDLSVLPEVQKRGGILVTDATVERIDMKGARAEGVSGRLASGARFQIKAPRVVVAGGAWHNPVLLRRSGLNSKHVGRHMTLHPSFRMMARFDSPVDGQVGALQSAYSSAFMEAGLTMVALFVPPGPIAGVLPGFGPSFMKETDTLSHVAIFGCLLHDEGGGRVWNGPGREPIVTYKMDQEARAMLPKAARISADIFFAAGAKDILPPIMHAGPMDADRFARFDVEHIPASRYEATSQHPLGTCRMGASPSESVVDPYGRLWGTDNVWVADGSIVPTSLGVNPQVTVMAMAHRVASHIR